MARHLPPLSTITAVFLLFTVLVHGRRGGSGDGSTSGGTSDGTSSGTSSGPSLHFPPGWDGAAFVIAIIATIFLGCLSIVSIQAFFMYLNKDPPHLFSQQPVVGEANTGQLFCTLVVLSLFSLTAYFPLFMVFILRDGAGEHIPRTLTYMVIYLGHAFAAGALLALVSHRRHLHFGREGTSLWKKGLDLAIIGFMITFIVIWTLSLLAALPYKRRSQALDVVEAMEHLRVAFYCLATIDIFVSAAFLWRRLKAAGICDQAISDLCFRASYFFISLAIFNIIEDALKRHFPIHHFTNFMVLNFFSTLINAVCCFFGLAWVLRVYRRKLGFCCYGY